MLYIFGIKAGKKPRIYSNDCYKCVYKNRNILKTNVNIKWKYAYWVCACTYLGSSTLKSHIKLIYAWIREKIC